MIKVLERQGFNFIRQKGSHIILQKKLPGTTATAVVPNHKELSPGTLRSILRKAGLSVEDLTKLLVLMIGISKSLP